MATSLGNQRHTNRLRDTAHNSFDEYTTGSEK